MARPQGPLYMALLVSVRVVMRGISTENLLEYLERGLDCFGESCTEFEMGRL